MGEELLHLLQYLFLGALQGFTEPIPISSSGHVVIAGEIMNVKSEGLGFETLVNFASLIAVLIIYRRDLIDLTTHSIGYVFKGNKAYKKDFMFVVYLLLATIPAGAIGLLLEDFITNTLSEEMKVIGTTLIITAIALYIIRNLKGHKGDHQISWKDALIVGLAQSVALIPGISRSGATIVAAMALGMKQQTALKFSFFLYIPISVGSMILEGSEIVTNENLSAIWIPYAIAFIASLIASYFSLRWFMGIMAKGNLIIFSIYCFIVGTAVILFL
ncbi:undecaprenyl-diphosphate phosphatase [Longirhabdus pacifica]|uniref:undecaprenyl-diphosphate phosphatase n=1 Tax=Longirhabdus pacifica TaxID=2305227 RepID=UPI00100876F5|nr:undecaprenyl-diphosphate phosphatase [Longirhabdus pacifica]